MPDYAALAKQFGATSSEPATSGVPVDYAALAKQFGADQSDPSPSTVTVQPSKGWPAKIGDAFLSALPTAGGIIGGMVGGVPGAAAGGAAGEGYRQLASHLAEIPGAIKDVATNLIAHPVETVQGFDRGAIGGTGNAALEAGGQAVGQGIGEAAAKFVGGPMAKWLMNRATSRVSAALMRDFPELSDTLIDNALTVSKGGEGQARSLLHAAKGAANEALKGADASARGIPIAWTPDLAESFKTALLEKAVKSGGTSTINAGDALTAASKRLDPKTRGLIDLVEKAAESGDVGHITPSQADLLKTQLQKESRALYANRVAPNGPKAMGMDATERAEFASRLNDAIDALAPGYKAANAQARPLIGAVRGLQQATRPNGNLYQAMVRPAVGAVTGGAIGQREGGTPGSALGAIAGAALTSPAGMSREAILLAHPAMQEVLRALPKPLAQSLTELLAERSGESR